MVLCTGAGAGFFPFAPGTAGTFVAAVILYGLGSIPVWLHILSGGLFLGLGIWACGEANRFFKKPDSRYIVWDEIVGFWIAMVSIPITPYWLFWGFVLFRIFDVTKLPPADYFDQRLKNGWGVMLDDVAAGIYTNIILQLMLRTQI